MRRFKSFGTPVLNSDEPIEFELYDQTFRCKTALQGRELLEFVSVSNGENFGASAEAVLSFIDTCITPDDRKKFQELTGSDSEKIVSMEVLTELAAWLVELYSSGDGDDKSGKDSADEESKASSNGQPTTTSSSKDTPSKTVSSSKT